jgi:hypothetical protein
VAVQEGGGGLGGEAERPSYGAAADTAHGQFCLAAIHGVQAMAATWSASCGPPLGFGGAVQGKRGQFPPGRASEAGASWGARMARRVCRSRPRAQSDACISVYGRRRKKELQAPLTGGACGSEEEGEWPAGWLGRLGGPVGGLCAEKVGVQPVNGKKG